MSWSAMPVGPPVPVSKYSPGPLRRFQVMTPGVTTTLDLHWAASAPRVWLDWVGPFSRRDLCEDDDCRRRVRATLNYFLDLNVADWRIRSNAGATVHSMDIAWEGTREAQLRFRAGDGACDGEPMVICNDGDCELRP